MGFLFGQGTEKKMIWIALIIVGFILLLEDWSPIDKVFNTKLFWFFTARRLLCIPLWLLAWSMKKGWN